MTTLFRILGVLPRYVVETADEIHEDEKHREPVTIWSWIGTSVYVLLIIIVILMTL
jgi:hypothetical protein